MGSKKHKKDSKKKKHRSRSRSPLEGEERERKRHRKHKDRKKDRSPDVEEVPVDSHLLRDNGAAAATSPTRSASAERDRRAREHRTHREEHHRERSNEEERVESPAGGSGSGSGGAGGGAGGGGAESLSVEETNKLRAKLGLKPLEVAEKTAEDGKIKDDLGEFYHKPAANIAQQKKADKIREKLDERREKRKLEQKLQSTALLGEASDEDDAMAWVRRSRDMEKQKREAAKRAALLDELDSEFGVGALVAETQRQELQRAYGSAALKGLRVAHHLDALGDERELVLTLADKDVLADDAEDVLVNVNIVDDEKYKKNIEERKKAKSGYKAYDDEADLEAAALGQQKPVLAKYDDEIHPERDDKLRGFVIGDEDALEAKRFRDAMRAQSASERRLESLQLPAPRLASDYLNEQELQAKFKRTKRKGKMRKKAKEEPIDVEDYDAGMAPLETDDTDVKMEQLQTPDAADDETEPDTELQAALARARRLRQQSAARPAPKVEELLLQAKQESEPELEAGAGGVMVLDATAEFCRTLGDIPTYGLAGNREPGASPEPEAPGADEPEPDEAAGAWSRVDVASERGQAPAPAGLEAEPALGCGVAGALRLALSKGYLEKAGALPAPSARLAHLLAARHYSIEDKAADEERGPRRERQAHGPLSDFREKPGFRPRVKLEYVDDDGRPLCAKEAFRYLSHKFHGKGPGKNKQEKRIKKAVQEGLMKKMSSTDTPLNTLQMLQDKQRETQSPYIVLSGAKREPNT